MKTTTILFFLLLIFISCDRNDNKINNLSDDAFFEIISNNKNSVKGISKIDSIIENNTLSNHKLALSYYQKAAYLMISRKYIESIAYIKKALSLFKENKTKNYIAKSYNLLANDNINLNRDEIALEQINIALSIFKNTNNKKDEVVALDVIARLYFRDAEYQKALNILKKSLKIYSTLNVKEKEFATYGNIGSIYKKIKDTESATLYYSKAINLNDKYNFLNSNPLQDLGLLYLENGNSNKCIDLHMRALEIQNKTGHLVIQKSIYDVLIDSIKGKELKSSIITGRYFNNLPSLIIKRDSVIKLIEKQKVEEQINAIESQYKLQTKKNELKQEIKLKHKNNWIFTIIVGLLLFLSLFLIQRSRNKDLTFNNEKILLEQKVLRSQMNPHFIFNALTSIQKNLLEADLLKSSTSLAKFAKLIRQNFEFTNKPLIGLDEDLEALKNYIETQQLRFEDKFDYQINAQKGLDLSFVQIPPMLLQPFVENAIEHGFKSKEEKGNLIINILKPDDLFLFEIIDDGIGFKEKTNKIKREHAIDIFLNRLKLRGFSEEKSFKITSASSGKGSKISFTLKL
jgi:tetratricopeptide (TPR) repeat protein